MYESQKTRMSLQSLATLCFVSVLLLSGSHAQELSKLHLHYNEAADIIDIFCAQTNYISQEVLLH